MTGLKKTLILAATVQMLLVATPLQSSGKAAQVRTPAEISKSKVLRIATRNRPGVSTPNSGGDPRGFHSCLAAAFARSLGAKLQVEWRSNVFKDYFLNDGAFDEKTLHDPKISYTPDVLKNVDIAVDAFSRTAWRDRLGRFVPVTVGRQLVVYRKDRLPRAAGPEDLKGRTIFVRKATVQEDLANDLARKVPITIKYYASEAGEATPPGKDLDPLIDGRADFMIYPASYSLVDARDNKKIGFGFAVGETDGAFWMVQRDNTPLFEALSRFISKSHDDGTLDRCFLEDYQMSYADFLRAISIVPAPAKKPAK